MIVSQYRYLSLLVYLWRVEPSLSLSKSFDELALEREDLNENSDLSVISIIKIEIRGGNTYFPSALIYINEGNSRQCQTTTNV